MVDPYTNSTQSYHNAMRHSHKSGQAWEGYSPRALSGWWLVLAGVVIAVVGLAVMS